MGGHMHDFRAPSPRDFRPSLASASEPRVTTGESRIATRRARTGVWLAGARPARVRSNIVRRRRAVSAAEGVRSALALGAAGLRRVNAVRVTVRTPSVPRCKRALPARLKHQQVEELGSDAKLPKSRSPPLRALMTTTRSQMCMASSDSVDPDQPSPVSRVTCPCIRESDDRGCSLATVRRRRATGPRPRAADRQLLLLAAGEGPPVGPAAGRGPGQAKGSMRSR